MAGATKSNATTKSKRRTRNKAKSKGNAANPPREKALAEKRAPKYKGLKMQGEDGRYISEADFIKMTLDPCHGPLTASPFGKTENSYIWRLNYRGTLLANATGNLFVALNPLGMYNGFGSASANLPQAIQIWNAAGLNDTTIGNSNIAVSVPGIQALEGVAAQLRVTAGCVKLNYIGAANVACGQLYAWEGQGDETFASVASSQAMTARQTPNSFMMSGMTAPITAGVESMLNYGKVGSPAQWQFGDVQVGRTDVFAPFAVVGVSNGPANAAYVCEVTVIVEWTPLLSQGVPAPVAASIKPGAADRVANALRLVAPLLVKTSSMALGGYAGLVGKAVTFGAQVYQALRA